ncbi:MAG TPA: RNA polymerase sigma factor [Trebonia sp.]|nr:RNA polymerase sigma factor [Trebonia sp.]
MDIGDGFDNALIRARTGDSEGFCVLWTGLQADLRRYLQGLGCDEVEDVASETWLHAIRDLRRFTGAGTDFRAWLFTIGRHRAIDAARSRARFRDKVRSLVPGGEPDGRPVEDEVLFRLSGEEAVALMAGLTTDQAAVVGLRVIAGLDTDVVAEILSKSRGAVRVCLHRALRALSADPRIRVLAQAGHDGV